MPAAAVIPAPIAYTNVVAVKKLVVGFQFDLDSPYGEVLIILPWQKQSWTSLDVIWDCLFYFEKIRVFKAGYRLEYVSME